MNWFKKKIRNWVFSNDISTSKLVPVRESDSIRSDGMRFTVYSASEGGWVIESNSYDRKTDRSDNRLYIVHDQENLGERMGHIISIEALRQ